MATKSYDRQVRIWKVVDGTLQYTLPDAALMAFSPDGSLLATTNRDSQIRLWSLRDGTVAQTITLRDDRNLLDQIVFSPDGTLLAVRDVDEVTLWRLRDGVLHQAIETEQFGTFLGRMLSFSPDGQTLATTGRSFHKGERATTVRLWRVTDGMLLHTLNVNEVLGERRNWIDLPVIAFSADGTRLVAVAHQWPYPDALLIWRAADGVLLEQSELVTESDLIRFSADGTAMQVYTTRYDTVRMYDMVPIMRTA